MKKYVCPTCNSRCDRPYCNECERTIPANCAINVADKAVEKHSIASNAVQKLEVARPIALIAVNCC